MNKLVFVPPLDSHPLVGYKDEGAYFFAMRSSELER